MKKEQYLCDVCGRQYGDELKQEQVEPIVFKAKSQAVGSQMEHHEFTVTDPCAQCAKQVAEAMIEAGKAAVEMVRAAAALMANTPPVQASPKKKRGRPRKVVDSAPSDVQ